MKQRARSKDAPDSQELRTDVVQDSDSSWVDADTTRRLLMLAGEPTKLEAINSCTGYEGTWRWQPSAAATIITTSG